MPRSPNQTFQLNSIIEEKDVPQDLANKTVGRKVSDIALKTQESLDRGTTITDEMGDPGRNTELKERKSPDDIEELNPPLKRSGRDTSPAQPAFSQFDGDVDSEFAGKMESFVKESITQAFGELSVKIRVMKKEIEDEFNSKIEQVKNGYSSQITET